MQEARVKISKEKKKLIWKYVQETSVRNTDVSKITQF
jgi:hypothetical protein